MERRASKRAESVKASRRIQCLYSPSMDPKLWGNLPCELLLKIYQALLIRDFYKLRVVCKEWNNVACERRRSSDRVRKPCFLLFPHGYKQCDSPSGTLAFNAAAGRWIWRRFESEGSRFGEVGDLYEPFVVEGIFLEGSAFWESFVWGSRPGPQNLLFDMQTDKSFPVFKARRTWFWKIPRVFPRLEGSILGMMVDTSRRPSNYKLIVGNSNSDTLILDSETHTWEPKPSRMVRCRAPCQSWTSPKSCVQCDGHMYVWSESDEIQVYSLEGDKWSTLDAPPRHASDDEFRGLGHWQSVLYAVTKNEQGTLSVWKLMDRATQKWSEFERIPSSLFSYLVEPHAVLPIVASHCNEYLLIHVCTDRNYGAKSQCGQKLRRRFVLFNISNKRWEIVALSNS